MILLTPIFDWYRELILVTDNQLLVVMYGWSCMIHYLVRVVPG